MNSKKLLLREEIKLFNENRRTFHTEFRVFDFSKSL